MFFHILTIQRQVDWIFCNVAFVKFPLDGVDSIDISDGSSNDDSVLSIVAFGVSMKYESYTSHTQSGNHRTGS